MAAPKTGMQEAVGAHVRGLAAALDGSEEGVAASLSVRRMARSLVSLAATFDSQVWVEEAQLVVECKDDELRDAARLLLDRLEQVAEDATRTEFRILLVEDNPTLVAAMQAYLNRPGYTLHVASTAMAGVEALRAGNIDLVLLDLILPDRDGRELLVEMKENPETARVPVVVLSAQSGPMARAECLALGASEFVEKPVRPDVLRSIVARNLTAPATGTDGGSEASTGLLDRVGISEAYESGKEGGVTVALIGLAGLEAVEDSLGPGADDRAFAEVAAFLAGLLPTDHSVGRWGGNELAVVAPGVGPEETRDALESMLTRLEEAPLPSGAAGGVSGRAGVAAGRPELSLKEALANADRALFWVKRFGFGHAATTQDGQQVEGDLGRSRVFFVEDDRVTAALVEHRLGREGFEVFHHSDGAEALEAARTMRADLAILDVKLPGLDGFALLKALRELPHFRPVPIMMLSSMGSEADVVRGLGAGADDYMLKPFSPAELTARLRRLTRSTHRADTGDSRVR